MTLLLNITKNILKCMIIVPCVSYFSIVTAHTLHAGSMASITDALKNIEAQTEGRLGIFALNTKNKQVIQYRATEIFPTGCTSKTIGVAAVLKKTMSDPALLSKKVMYTKADLDAWSPVTEKYLTEGMTIKELCAASISFSDNTSMNLLLKYINGVQGMNDFAHSIGDTAFRQDNNWPAEAYSGGKHNLKDSSTPKAMVESLRKLTLGSTLARPQRDLFTTWLIDTKTGTKRIRSAIPKGWIVGNKTGTNAAYGSTNDVAIIWPVQHDPIFIGVYYTSENAKAANREDVISTATKAVIDAFIQKDNTLK